jgi:hypothetical protein
MADLTYLIQYNLETENELLGLAGERSSDTLRRTKKLEFY